MNLILDDRQAPLERRDAWHGAERRAGQPRRSDVTGERALLITLIAILALTALRWGAQPQAQTGPGGAPARAAAAGAASHIGVVGAEAAGLREAVALIDPQGVEAPAVINTTGNAGPEQAARDAGALGRLLADRSVCVALALAPPGDLAEARRLANTAAGADKPVVLVFAGVDSRLRLLNRGNSRLFSTGSAAEGAARALDLARLRGCAPRIEAAPLPARS